MPDLGVTIPFAFDSELALRNSGGDPWAKEWLKNNVAGSGAFKVESWKPGTETICVRNENWACGPKPAMRPIITRADPILRMGTERGAALRARGRRVAELVGLHDPRVTLLDLLRERLQLTGTKGLRPRPVRRLHHPARRAPVNACLALAASHDAADIVTIEGLATHGTLHPAQAAFLEHDALQCGFCTPGQIVSAVGLNGEAQTGDDPERVREAMSGNLCRCGAYAGITEAVLDAQTRMRAEPVPGRAP